MKIIHVNFSGSKGGAAIAAARLNNALQKQNIDSELWCARESGSRNHVRCIKGRVGEKLDSLKNVVVQRLLGGLNVVDVRSINIFPSGLVRKLNASDADVINFHWINAEMVSLRQLSKLKKPVVWTLHDMWPFCGAEHYTESCRYIDGYSKESFKPSAGSRKLNVDLDRWVFKRKQKAWENWEPTIVTPSHWLSECARQSVLFKNLPISTIHNCLDLETFKPLSRKKELRRKYGVPEDKKIILFGAFSVTDSRKGGDLLEKALSALPNKKDYILAIFGTHQVKEKIAGINAVALGRLSSDEALAEVYNLADIMCVPSRQDNLPNTAVEANACGLPVVSFRVGGLSDIIDHQISGYLAKPFDVEDFACGIAWVFKQADGRLCRNARSKAENTFAELEASRSYIDVYRLLLTD